MSTLKYILEDDVCNYTSLAVHYLKGRHLIWLLLYSPASKKNPIQLLILVSLVAGHTMIKDLCRVGLTSLLYSPIVWEWHTQEILWSSLCHLWTNCDWSDCLRSSVPQSNITILVQPYLYRQVYKWIFIKLVMYSLLSVMNMARTACIPVYHLVQK